MSDVGVHQAMSEPDEGDNEPRVSHKSKGHHKSSKRGGEEDDHGETKTSKSSKRGGEEDDHVEVKASKTKRGADDSGSSKKSRQSAALLSVDSNPDVERVPSPVPPPPVVEQKEEAPMTDENHAAIPVASSSSSVHTADPLIPEPSNQTEVFNPYKNFNLKQKEIANGTAPLPEILPMDPNEIRDAFAEGVASIRNIRDPLTMSRIYFNLQKKDPRTY